MFCVENHSTILTLDRAGANAKCLGEAGPQRSRSTLCTRENLNTRTLWTKNWNLSRKGFQSFTFVAENRFAPKFPTSSLQKSANAYSSNYKLLPLLEEASDDRKLSKGDPRCGRSRVEKMKRQKGTESRDRAAINQYHATINKLRSSGAVLKVRSRVEIRTDQQRMSGWVCRPNECDVKLV